MILSSRSFVRKGALALVLSAFATSAFAAEYIVNVKKGVALDSTFSTLKSLGVEVTDSHERGQLVLVETGNKSIKEDARILVEINNLSEVNYVVKNIRLHTFAEPNDPKFGEQWALKKVSAAQAWDKQAGSKEVIVSVIDTGVDWKHPDLKDTIWTNPNEIAGNGQDDDGNGFVDDVRGWDFNKNDNDPMDETSGQNPGHGTHCAGIVGATGDNGVGISGMAQNITIMPVRFLGSDGGGDLMAGAKSIDYATDNGAHIISASWGAAVARSQMQPIMDAILRANEKGVIFVAAAANDGKNNDTTEVYPANVGTPNAISVAASNTSDGKPSWSNYGKATVDLASPGEGIMSTLPSNRFGNLSGTSMATPLVSGLVALLKSQAMAEGKELNGAQARSILQMSGAAVNIETACNCRVDANGALDFIMNDSLTAVPAAKTVAENGTQKFEGFGGQAPYTFTSSNPSIATITAEGELKAVAKGETVLTITDANGATAQTKNIFVGRSGGGGGGEVGECPLDPQMCTIMCQMDPTLPWCS